MNGNVSFRPTTRPQARWLSHGIAKNPTKRKCKPEQLHEYRLQLVDVDPRHAPLLAADSLPWYRSHNAVSPPVGRFFDQRARHRVAVDSAHSEGASYRRERQSHSLAPATSRCLPLRYYFNSGRCHSTVKSQSFFKRVVNGPWRIARIGLVAASLTQRLCWLPPSRHRHLLPHRHQVQAPRPHPIRFS